MLLLGAAYLLALLIVSPQAEFPLIDDWNYALLVRHLLDEDQLQVNDWAPMTLVFQLAWGGLFATLFGFSFTVLRVSTLVLSFVGSLALYALCREVGVGRPQALLGALALWLNPIIFGLSYTFMTDVPYLGLTILATLCYVRGVGRGSDRDLVLGAGCAAAAFLVRQQGALLPLALLAYGLLARWPPRRLAWRGLLGAGLPALAVGGHALWQQQQGVPQMQQGIIAAILRDGLRLWPQILLLAAVVLVYLGLFWLPLALGFFDSGLGVIARLGSAGQRAVLLGWGALIAGLVLFLAQYDGGTAARERWLPYMGQLLQPSGWSMPHVLGWRAPILSVPVRAFVTVAAAGALFLLGALLYSRGVATPRPAERHRPAVALAALIGLFQFLGIFPPSINILSEGSGRLSFDRYLVPVAPAVIVLGLWAARGLRLSRAGVVLGLLGFACVSLTTTQDWFAYNRVRWDLGHELVTEGVPLEQIDAGFEWDSWFLYEHSQAQRLEARTPDGPFWTRLAAATDSTYVVAFSPLPGYDIVRERRYTSWLAPEPVPLYVLKRQ